MQSFYPETFERDMACTEAEWLLWLPRAVGAHPYQVTGSQAQVSLGAGRLQLAWRVEPPRVIALMRLPRLALRFAFSGVSEEQRHVFMKRFDLYTQRGGG
ncbi:hypothetical protein [Rhodoferax sp. BAB1]|uniref:hypothetical protein n=1 Tax=Rhodoferax sp. BAB1 TaxID=2741720 RepID=UPI0015755280|nr:hypothetical protein [Rhodoferax sp. BAB1]QKO21186.1 hypothetical protein HTY51_04465 [Rhodoferax sp. BAB1]